MVGLTIAAVIIGIIGAAIWIIGTACMEEGPLAGGGFIVFIALIFCLFAVGNAEDYYADKWKIELTDSGWRYPEYKSATVLKKEDGKTKVVFDGLELERVRSSTDSKVSITNSKQSMMQYEVEELHGKIDELTRRIKHLERRL